MEKKKKKKKKTRKKKEEITNEREAGAVWLEDNEVIKSRPV